MLRCADIEPPKRWESRQSSVSQNAMEGLTRLAKERAAKDGTSYEDALRAVIHENPELWRRASQAVTEEVPTEHGKVTASEVLARKASARAKENGSDYQTALSEVCRENQDLARAWDREIQPED